MTLMYPQCSCCFDTSSRCGWCPHYSSALGNEERFAVGRYGPEFDFVAPEPLMFK